MLRYMKTVCWYKSQCKLTIIAKQQDLSILEKEDVRIKPYLPSEKEWKKAVVTERLDHKSYEVATEHAVFRLNCIDLKKTQEPPPPTPLQSKLQTLWSKTTCLIKDPRLCVTTLANKTVLQPQMHLRTNVTMQTSPIERTRSDRSVKPPSVLKDLVC